MEIRRDVFQAIADPTRRAILSFVALHAMTAGAIAANFESSRQTVSKHIQILYECQLLNQTQSGREIYYELNPEKMKEIAEWLQPFHKLWDERFKRLDILLDKHKTEKNEQGQ